MGIGYLLVNTTKEELICFEKLGISKKNEIIGSGIGSAVVTLYLLNNIGDSITFIPDQYKENEWPLGKIGPRSTRI